MENTLDKTLRLLGLSTKQVRFYQASFKIGPTSINEVAKAARLERSTAYLLAQELIDLGVIEEDLKDYGKKVFAADPKKLLQMISSKQRTLRHLEIELEDKLPELQALYSVSEIRPKVRVFEGNSGLYQVWKDILSSKGEVLLWTNQATEDKVFTKENHQRFIAERIKKGLKIRVLAISNSEGEKLKQADSEELRETHLLPKDVEFSAETYIYDNKVAILDYNKDIFGLIIESQPVSTTHKAIFEMNWKFT